MLNLISSVEAITSFNCANKIRIFPYGFGYTATNAEITVLYVRLVQCSRQIAVKGFFFLRRPNIFSKIIIMAFWRTSSSGKYLNLLLWVTDK